MNGVQFITIGGLSLLLTGGALTIAGASLYDATEAKRSHQLVRHPQARALRRRPLISVIIFSESSSLSLEDCLNSLAAGIYRKYEVIIIAKDQKMVQVAVNRFQTAHPSKTVRVLSLGSKSRQKALKTARGELVMVLNRPIQLQKAALKQAANCLALEPRTNMVLIEPHLTAQPSLTNLVYRFKAAAAGQLRKAAATTGRGGFTRPPAVYRRQYLVQYPPAPAFSLKLAEWFFLLLCLALGAYGLYLAASVITTYLLAILWAGLGLFLLLAIWGDNRFTRRQKLQLSLLTPPLSGLLYLNLLLAALKAAAKTVSKA